jgi:hypothetical protein
VPTEALELATPLQAVSNKLRLRLRSHAWCRVVPGGPMGGQAPGAPTHVAGSGQVCRLSLSSGRGRRRVRAGRTEVRWTKAAEDEMLLYRIGVPA